MNIRFRTNSDRSQRGSLVDGTIENGIFTGSYNFPGGYHVSSSPGSEFEGSMSEEELVEKMRSKISGWDFADSKGKTFALNHGIVVYEWSEEKVYTTAVVADRHGYWTIIEGVDTPDDAVRQASNLSEDANLEYASNTWVGWLYKDVDTEELCVHNCEVAMSHGTQCQCGYHLDEVSA